MKQAVQCTYTSYEKPYSCIGICYAKLFEAANPCSNHEIHMLFKHGFYLKKPKLGLICMHDITLESVAAVTDHFVDAFIRENVARLYMMLWRHNDVRKFEADAILFLEIKCNKRDI